MNAEVLSKLLAEIQPALVAAVTDGIRNHVAKLRSQGKEFYGYALLPGEPYDIHSLVAVTNNEDDIKVPTTDDQYHYYRFSVDEWEEWHQNEFASVKALLTGANKRFALMHPAAPSNCIMDKFEVAYSNGLLGAIVDGINATKTSGVFGDNAPFLVVWISDSDEAVIIESVKHLNSPAIANEFMMEFG